MIALIKYKNNSICSWKVREVFVWCLSASHYQYWGSIDDENLSKREFWSRLNVLIEVPHVVTLSIFECLLCIRFIPVIFVGTCKRRALELFVLEKPRRERDGKFIV